MLNLLSIFFRSVNRLYKKMSTLVVGSRACQLLAVVMLKQRYAPVESNSAFRQCIAMDVKFSIN